MGDIGAEPGANTNLNMSTKSSDTVALFAMIELHRTTDDETYLTLTDVIAHNIVRDRFVNGFFLPSRQHLNASFNAIEPLALLSLEAAHRGTSDAVPAYNSGQPFIHGPFDGLGRAKDDRAIWMVKATNPSPRTRGEAG